MMDKIMIFKTRVEAEQVMNELEKRLNKYGSVSCADLDNIIGSITKTLNNHNSGWVRLDGSTITKVKYGYSVNLLAPIDIRGI